MYNACLSGLQNKEGLRQSEKVPPPKPSATEQRVPQQLRFSPLVSQQPPPPPPSPTSGPKRSGSGGTTRCPGQRVGGGGGRGAWGHPQVSAAGGRKKRWRGLGWGEGNQKYHFLVFFVFFFFFFFPLAKRFRTRWEGRSGRCASPNPGWRE